MKLNQLLNIVSLGGCGNKLGMQFDKMQFITSYINFDSLDVIGINKPSYTEQSGRGKILVLSGEGTGRSIKKGLELFGKSEHLIKDFINKNTYDDKINVFLVGLGGGSGSSLIKVLSEYVLTLNRKIAVIATLPSSHVSGGLRARENAYNVLREIKDIPYSFFLLADNELLSKKLNINPLSDGWDIINEKIISNFLNIENIVSRQSSLKGVGNIDSNELLSTIVSGGFTSVISEKLTFTDIENINLTEFLSTHELTAGFDYGLSDNYCISFQVPESKMPDNVKQFTTDLIKKFNPLARAGFFGTFFNPDLQGKIVINILANSLPLPKSVASRIKNLVRDKQRADDKNIKKHNKTDSAFDILAENEISQSTGRFDFE